MHATVLFLVVLLSWQQSQLLCHGEQVQDDMLESSYSREFLVLHSSQVAGPLETPYLSHQHGFMTEFPDNTHIMMESTATLAASSIPVHTPVHIMASSVVGEAVASSSADLMHILATDSTGTSQGGCVDRTANCAVMGISVCTAFISWAQNNCAKFCYFCDDGSGTTPQPMTSTPAPTTTTTPEPTTTEKDCCVDQLGWQACISYRLESCQGPYAAWASVRCQAFCGMCKPCKIEPCEDLLDNCEEYGQASCVADNYRIWAYQNCRRHCGLCTNYGYYYQLHNVSVTGEKPTAAPAQKTTAAPDTRAPSAATTTGSGSTSGSGLTTGSPACEDKVTHCHEYGLGDCTTFSSFMSFHCPRYCGLCSVSETTESASTPTPTVIETTESASTPTPMGFTDTSSILVMNGSTVEPKGKCEDMLENCTNVRKENCCGLHSAWAEKHCAKYCGYCGVVPDRLCEDTIDHCDRESPDLCTSGLYDLFRQNNCAGYCKICDQPWKPPSCTAHLFPTQATTESEAPPSMTTTETAVSNVTEESNPALVG